jgi:hypothetical protein
MRIQILTAFTAILLFAACTDTEIGNSKDISPDAIAQDFSVTYNEGNKDLNIKTKFRVSGITGTTLVLNSPSRVVLNNNNGTLDSNKFDGAYYKWQLPLNSANGTHTISFTNSNGKTLNNMFNFNGFALESAIPETVNQNQNLVLPFKGIANNEKLLVILTDTSTSKAAEYLDVLVNNNKLTISSSDLQKLKKGYVSIEIMYKKTESLKELTNEEGKLTYNYTLNKRSFNLQ